MKFGLIGRSLQHSYSQRYFEEHLLQDGDTYELIELEDSELSHFVATTDLDGFNVTIPFKINILLYIDEISDAVAAIGSANCIKRTNMGWYAENTDTIGFQKTIEKYEHIDTMQAIILGTGGSSRAVAYVFKQIGIPYLVVSRTPQTDQISYRDLAADIIGSHHIIVNCTPLGMSPDVDSYPPIDYDALSANHICIDLIYNPEKSIFLAKAEEKNAKIENGLGMLYAQADASYEYWTSTDL